MTKSDKEYEEKRTSQKIFLLNSIISDNTISDNGIMVYCYLKAIQRADMNYYAFSIDVMNYFFTHSFDIDTRDKKKYVDGLNDLEKHGLIRKINEKRFNFEYDLQPIFFDPTKTNKENKLWFTVIYSDELNAIMQINDKEFTGSKIKLIRYFVNVVSTFMNGAKWTYDLPDGSRTDGVIGFSSIETLANISNINKDTVVTYNKVLEKAKILYIYRAKDLMLINNELTGITNTYGRYKYKKFVIGEGEEHKAEYGHKKLAESIKHKTKKTTERKSLGAKYYNLVSGNKLYDEKTIIDIYRYAVEYNRIHGDDYFYEDKLKDLDFFEQFPFITEDCLKEKPKRKLPDDVWGEPDPLEKDFSIEEINNMPTLSDFVEENTG